jgi:Cu(I)/Ag(I) efflux system membrane fusion protein
MAETESTIEPHSSGGNTRRRFWAGLAVLAALGIAFFAGWASRSPQVEVGRPGIRPILYYVDPMHPAYRSERPGKAPDCGMDLVPVYATGQPANAAAMNPGSVRLTEDQKELIHLETETLRRASAHEVQTVGRVVPDESMTFRVSAGVDGWVRRVFSDKTGTQVKKGQELAAFYSKDVSSPQQAYIFALESYERLKKPASAADQLELATRQLAIARDNLQFMGMGEAQIEELGRSHREIFDVNLTAPEDGQILERNVSVGQRFMKGEVLYDIANLSRVWVLADIYARDAAPMGHIRRAQVTIEGLAPMEASVAQAPLQVDGDGRTGKLRLEVNNVGRRLVPGMIVNVAFTVAADSAMTLSVDAVLDSGAKKRVFVAKDESRYELREVETGWQDGDRVEIKSGLKEGEKVVTTGAFLLDSESRLKNPELREQGTVMAGDEVTDPACGLKIDRTKARRLTWKGTTYYFSSASCQAKFEAHPEAFLSSSARPTK